MAQSWLTFILSILLFRILEKNMGLVVVSTRIEADNRKLSSHSKTSVIMYDKRISQTYAWPAVLEMAYLT